MQLDDMKAVWATHGEQLDRVLHINEKLLRDVTMNKVRSSLIPYVLWRAFEVLFGVAMTLATGSVLLDHTDELLYLSVAGAVLLFSVFMTITTLMLIVRALRLDQDRQVVDVQRAVAKLKLAEFHAFKWALLGGVLLWLPIGIVVFEVLSGAPALSNVPLPWLLANIAFGLLALFLGQHLVRKHVDKNGQPDTERAPWVQRLLDHASGRQLAKISNHMDELASFRSEGSES